MYSWMKDDTDLPRDTIFEVNPTLGYLQITMVTPNRYVCMARNRDGTVCDFVCGISAWAQLRSYSAMASGCFCEIIFCFGWNLSSL